MSDTEHKYSKEEIEARKKQVKDTLCCPYCDEPLKKWLVPQTVFTQWPNEFMYICFNDECSYVIRNREAMQRMGNAGSQRLMYDPEQDCCQPIPIMHRNGLRDGIIEETAEKVQEQDESTPAKSESKGFFSSLFSKFGRKGAD